MYTYFGKNRRPFSAIVDCNFGRQIITTRKKSITSENIVDELNKALPIHHNNKVAIEYLDRYYRGDQPILYREKKVRPEVNNKIVVNLAQYLVDTKTSEMAGEPIQYVLHGTDEKKSEQIKDLNAIMQSESKDMLDISLCRWRSICGTAYRYIGNDDGNGSLLDETEFYLSVPDPTKTFVVYYENSRPAFSCQIGKNDEDKTVYFCYTNRQWFSIIDSKIVESGINGNMAIPVIEYPNNERRLSDIEITISITDAINKLASDRINGVEQFVQSFVKFVNCEIDKEKFDSLRSAGAFTVKSNNGDNKADVDILSSELNQTQGQIVIQDLFDKFLIIHGLSNREGNTGGDTAGAVLLRDGFYTQEKRSELSEPIFKDAERKMVRIILNRLRITRDFTLLPSDVEIKITRSKRDNMLTKAQTMQLLMTAGINPARAIKTVGLFSDPEQVATESAKRLAVVYPEEAPAENKNTTVVNEVDNINNV